jgi:precorrin-6x reductase
MATTYNDGVYTFENLRQRTDVVGETRVVQAKAKPFVAKNAHGDLREVSDYKDAAALGSEAGKKILALLGSKNG